MSLADLAPRATQPAIPWRVCAACHVAKQLPESDRQLLDTLLASHIGASEIATHLTDEGHGRVGEDAVRRHRRGSCTNGKAYTT